MGSSEPVKQASAGTPHRVGGVVALLIIVAMALGLPSWGGLREVAVVQASRTFRLSAPEPQRYEWTLIDGRLYGALLLERGELAGLEVEPIEALPEGGQIEAGFPLARLSLPRSERYLAELKAEREALRAQRDLLAAGARDVEVEQARQLLQLARAKRERTRTEVERLRALAPEGAASAADLKDAELEDAERQREVDVAVAAWSTTRAGARPEAIEAVEAQIHALDAGIQEMETLLASARIESPIPGLPAPGTRPGDLLVVYELDPVYLHIPISGDFVQHIRVGDPVTFSTDAAPDLDFSGEIVALAPTASLWGSTSVVWASARIANPRGQLRPGMAGVARVKPDAPDRWGVLPAVRYALRSP